MEKFNQTNNTQTNNLNYCEKTTFFNQEKLIDFFKECEFLDFEEKDLNDLKLVFFRYFDNIFNSIEIKLNNFILQIKNEENKKSLNFEIQSLNDNYNILKENILKHKPLNQENLNYLIELSNFLLNIKYKIEQNNITELNILEQRKSL